MLKYTDIKTLIFNCNNISQLSVLCPVCHVFLPLVSIFGLFPVLVKCDYELIRVQLCVCDYVLITLCI